MTGQGGVFGAFVNSWVVPIWYCIILIFSADVGPMLVGSVGAGVGKLKSLIGINTWVHAWDCSPLLIYLYSEILPGADILENLGRN